MIMVLSYKKYKSLKKSLKEVKKQEVDVATLVGQLNAFDEEIRDLPTNLLLEDLIADQLADNTYSSFMATVKENIDQIQERANEIAATMKELWEKNPDREPSEWRSLMREVA